MSDEATEAADEVAEIPDTTEQGPEHELRYLAVSTEDRGAVVLHAARDTYLDTAGEAAADGFDQLIDLTAVDYLAFAAPRSLPEGVDAERFEVVVQLINHQSGERIRIRTQVPADEAVLPSLFDLWPGSEALEREVYDMFGIEFADHPDLSRILMPEDWVGHPLRKDYAVGSIPVQFKAASNIR